jgi:16S rRNA processing protein RimM
MGEDLLTVGVVTGTHGVGGELKVKSYSGSFDHILALREAFFRKGREEKKLRLDSVRPQPPGVILKISGIASPEQAHRFVGYEIRVPRPQAARLLEGEYYAADLCLCNLWFGEEEIGSVRAVWEGGAAELLEVQSKAGRTFLVPFIDHFIGEVQLEKRKILLREDEIVR